MEKLVIQFIPYAMRGFWQLWHEKEELDLKKEKFSPLWKGFSEGGKNFH